jgi:hypothetical protein
LGNLFKEYINKPLIPNIFNKIKDNEIIIMGNATRHYTAHNPTVNFNSDTITFKDSSKKLKLSRIKFAKKIKYIGEYRYFITFSISLINLLCQIDANIDYTNYLLNFDELLLPEMV